jgi:phospholipid/cholesterol/gamma-HCH transport system ATP-binding protein
VTGEPFIRYEGLEKAFGSNRVLRGVDLSIYEGETVVVLGGSGTGKSVLLKHTIGLLYPDAGRVHVEGEEVTNLSEDEFQRVRKKVSMLFQAGALFDSMSVFENVAYALREHTEMSQQQIRDRVTEVLSHVELPGVEELMPVELSGGMRRRVALARAIALQPRGLLYDEPTTGLDPLTAGAINRLIRRLQQTLKVTSIVVTHDILSTRVVADRIAWLSEGRMEFIGTLAEAMANGSETLRRFLVSGGGIGENRQV